MDSKLVIIGAGPAGTRAAQVLVEAGMHPVVIDEGLRSGGQIYRRQPAAIMRDAKAIYGFDAGKASQAHAIFDQIADKLDYRPQSTVWGVDGKRLELLTPHGMERIEWDRLIIAAGAMDRIAPIPGWTLPGVFSLGGAQVALKYQACRIGNRPIFIGTGPLLFLMAYQYMKAGASVQGVLDVVPFSEKIRALPGMMSGGMTFAKGLYYTARLRATGVPIHFGVTSMKVNDAQNGSVTSLEWRTSVGRKKITQCDAVAMGCGLRSETQIADLYDAKFAYDAIRRQWLPEQDNFGRTSVDGIYLAGDGAGIAGVDVAELTGRRAALAVLHDIGAQDGHHEITRINRQIARSEKFRRAMEIHAFAASEQITGSTPDDVMICRCEGITAGDIRGAVSNFGIRDINRAKANCRVGMGRCQGRLCQDVAAEILAQAAGVTVEAVGRLRGQAPLKPVSLQSLAERALP